MADVVAVAREGAPVRIAPGVTARLARARRIVERFAAGERAVYGLNTGLGAAVDTSLGQHEVALYTGQWGGQSGKLWLDDLALEELALVNVLRRPGCPFTVTSADGKLVYEEGKDYLPVRDELLGLVPKDYDIATSALPEQVQALFRPRRPQRCGQERERLAQGSLRAAAAVEHRCRGARARLLDESPHPRRRRRAAWCSRR